MTDQITRQAQRALRRAWSEDDIANFSDCQFLGILGESTCVAARILARLGLDLRQARRDALEIARSRPALTGPVEASAGDGWERAIDLVQDRGGCLDTPYFLLGVLEEDSGATVGTLVRQGVAIEAVRTALADVCGRSAEAEGGTLPHPLRKGADAWLAELRDTNPKVRLRAAMTLPSALTLGEVDLDPADAVPVLVELLRDPETLVRLSAADALGHFGPAAAPAADALRRALDDVSEVRACAADSLARIGPAGADAKSFEQALRDPSLPVRVAAAAGLWEITHQPEPILPVLIEGLASVDELVRSSAADTAGKLGPAAAPAVPGLVAILTARQEMPISASRLAALTALRAIGPAAREAVPTLVGLLGDGNLVLGGAIAAALAALAPGEPEVVPALQGLLRDPRPGARVAATEVLGLLGPAGSPAVPALQDAVADSDGMVRVCAAAALGRLGQGEEAIPVLVAALGHSGEHVAATAAGALGALGPAAAAAVPALRLALTGPDPLLRVSAAGALWRIEQDTAAILPVLQAALSDENLPARHHA